eukprot:1963893-Heterocapsa_arctica.AAC.1
MRGSRWAPCPNAQLLVMRLLAYIVCSTVRAGRVGPCDGQGGQAEECHHDRGWPHLLWSARKTIGARLLHLTDLLWGARKTIGA